MHTFNQALAVSKAFLFGSASLRQQCPIGLRDPQSEISVWLHGLGTPRDVTNHHVMAAARPLIIGIGRLATIDSERLRQNQTSLEFREQYGETKLLGRIDLRWKETIPLDTEHLCLFETEACWNYCLPKARVWARYAHHAYRNWRTNRRSASSGSRIPARDLRCVFVFYICPRPVVLVSVRDENLVNIFPMDLIGSVGTHHFSLALHTSSSAVPLLEQSRRIALSSLPVEQISVAYELGQNHRKPCVDLGCLPFDTSPSAAFGLPVPRFSLRVREMLIDEVRDLGSHKLFLARTIEDQHWAKGLQLFFVHGIYDARRRQSRLESANSDSVSCSHRFA